MRILVIDQCSGSKDSPDWFEKYAAEEIDSHSREELLNEVRDRVPGLRAEKLYTGRQQQFITEACERLRKAGDDVDRLFISAGFGLVDESTELPPYEVTFNDYSRAEIHQRGETLSIGTDIQTNLTGGQPYDIVFFALGQSYLESFDLEEVLLSLPEETTAVLFNQETLAEKREHVHSLPARTAEAKQFGTIVVAVKGQYLQHFAAHRERGTEPETGHEIVECCEAPPTSQSTFEGL